LSEQDINKTNIADAALLTQYIASAVLIASANA
jgi:hypothetical protein